MIPAEPADLDELFEKALLHSALLDLNRLTALVNFYLFLVITASFILSSSSFFLLVVAFSSMLPGLNLDNDLLGSSSPLIQMLLLPVIRLG